MITVYKTTMGIRDLSKVFQGTEKKLKDFSGYTLAIDGSTELYRAALGMKSIKGLSDSTGKSTLYISVILHNLIAYKKHNIKQIWVFDNAEINSYKKLELGERKRQKEKAKKKLSEVKEAKKMLNKKMYVRFN